METESSQEFKSVDVANIFFRLLRVNNSCLDDNEKCIKWFDWVESKNERQTHA